MPCWLCQSKPLKFHLVDYAVLTYCKYAPDAEIQRATKKECVRRPTRISSIGVRCVRCQVGHRMLIVGLFMAPGGVIGVKYVGRSNINSISWKEWTSHV